MQKHQLFDIIEAKASLLTDLSDRIWAYAELSLMERKSTDAYIHILESEGFHVTSCLCGIPTAFKGSFGTGKPVIGILGEYDALSGLSQQPGITHAQAQIPGGNGHGCGHNLLGVGALGAAIALKEAIASGDIEGTVVFYGCPGEEGCAGKTFMARDGQFRDLDAAITWHPGDTNEIMVGSNAASIQMVYSFTGVAAHAAGDPWNGRSALDAAELMNIGVQYLREHMEPKCSVHYAYLDAGCVSPNVVQNATKLVYMVRGENVRQAKALLKRVDQIAQGAALMSECSVSSYQVDGTSSTLSNQILEQVLHNNLVAAPLPVYDDSELDFAQKLKSTFLPAPLSGTLTNEIPALKQFVMKQTNNGTVALNNFVFPYYPSYAFSPGSTDVGDVSWLTPTAQFTAVTWPSGSPGHSWQNVSCGKTSLAHKGMLYAAKVLAGTGWDLMHNPQLLSNAREEFSISAAEGYDCPIGPDLVAKPC